MTCTSLSHQWLSSIIFKIIVNVAWTLTSSATEDDYNMNRQTWRHDNIFNEIYDENWFTKLEMHCACTVQYKYKYKYIICISTCILYLCIYGFMYLYKIDGYFFNRGMQYDWRAFCKFDWTPQGPIRQFLSFWEFVCDFFRCHGCNVVK